MSIADEDVEKSSFDSDTCLSTISLPAVPPNSPAQDTGRYASGGDEDFHASDIQSLFLIVEIQGKGLGMIATSTIRRGQCILAEAPKLRFSRFAPDAVIESLFSELDPQTQFLLLQLSNCRGTGPNIIDIVYTSAIPLNGTKNHAGLFPLASRINHACNPNTSKSWNPATGMLSLHATREIQPGEEITLTYINGLDTCQNRQAHLLDAFGFFCRCELCSLDFAQRFCSDFHINVIKSIRHSLQLMPTALSGRLRAIKSLLHMYEKISVTDARVPRAYCDAYRTAVRHHDARRALVFAQRSARLFAEVEGEEGPRATRMRDQARQMREVVEQLTVPLAAGEGGDDWLFMGSGFCGEERVPTINAMQQPFGLQKRPSRSV